MQNLKAKKGIVSAGHTQTAEAAIEILNVGGNAYDAAIAALLASYVTEPCMSSAGGGGFMIAHTADKKNLLFDFFCQTPKHKKPLSQIDFYPIELNFGDAKETFHIGAGSVATPGSIAGIFDIHDKMCTLPMKALVEPAIKYAKEGVTVDAFQHYDFLLLQNIIKGDKQMNPSFFPSNNGLIKEGETLAFPEMADYLDYLTKEGPRAFYEGEIARKIVDTLSEKGGFINLEDLKEYKATIRQPYSFNYKGYQLITNPYPSVGGGMIDYALKNIEQVELPEIFSEKHLDLLYRAIGKAQKEWAEVLKNHQAQANKRGCTTHFSILDEDGNAAGVSSTNGEGSACSIPGTQIMLNNMLGEAALFPNGFHSWPCNTRVSSLMSPTIALNKSGRAVIVTGSGGAGRIPAVIMQCIHYMLDYEMASHDAIKSPRVYLENGKLDVEPGFSLSNNHKIPDCEIARFSEQDMYFGGVHTVTYYRGKLGGAGDKRRSGVLLKN